VFFVVVGYFTIYTYDHQICEVFLIVMMCYGLCLFTTQSMVSYIYWSLENTKAAVWERMNGERDDISDEETEFMSPEEAKKVYRDDEELSNYWNQFLNPDSERLAT